MAYVILIILATIVCILMLKLELLSKLNGYKNRYSELGTILYVI